MKRKFLFLLFLFFGLRGFGQSPTLAWARVIGNTGGTAGSVVTIDAAGNTYAGGIYTTSITIGSTTLNHTGGATFLAKFDPAGNAIWAKDLPGISGLQDDVNPDKLIVDDQGNIYLTATYYGALQIDGLQLPAPTQFGAFCLVKLNSSGVAQWVRIADVHDNTLGNTSSIRFDPQGNICLTGLYVNEVELSGNITITSSTPGAMDAFACTYDPAGNIVRYKGLGISTNPAEYSDMEIFKTDAAGNLYRFISLNKTVVKYDTSGQVLLNRTIQMTGMVGTCMAIDHQQNILIGGYSYDQGCTIEGNYIPPVSGGPRTDAQLFKLDASGTLVWYRQFQYVLCDAHLQIRTDALGNIYGIGQHSECVGGQGKALMTKYDKDGALIWHDTIGPGPLPAPTAPLGHVLPYNIVQAHNGGNIVAIGYFKVRIRFDASTSFTIPDGNYIFRMFLAQYGTCNTPVPGLSPNSDTSFCEGDSLQLIATGGTHYLWSTGDTTARIYITSPGNYSVISVENNECYGQSEEIRATVLPLPDPSVTQNGAVLTATATGMDYQWIDCSDNSAIAGATAQNFNVQQPGSYAVILTDPAGCESVSQCITVENVGLNENTSVSMLLYPNPADELIRLESAAPVETIRIYDAAGKTLQVLLKTNTVNISSLAPGLYFIVAETAQGSWKGKFIRR